MDISIIIISSIQIIKQHAKTTNGQHYSVLPYELFQGKLIESCSIK